jgi:CDP-diacylglycerol--serine O-phosphatidyltransferase
VPPLRYFVPNGFTALSMLLGLSSVVMSVQGNFRLAAWMILWGVLLDKVDGSAARLLKASSEFGVQFDSFADFVSFGVAPGALVYFRLLATGRFQGASHALLGVAAGLYVVALSVRLARFNITTGGESVFFGIPGTLMGAAIASGYLTWEKYGLGEQILTYSPAVLVVGAALMVSTLRLPKLKLRKNKALNALQIGNVAAAYILGPLMMFPEYLLTLALAYMVGGLAWCLAVPDTPAQTPAAEAEDQDEQPRERLA